jgi:hypothetical protein
MRVTNIRGKKKWRVFSLATVCRPLYQMVMTSRFAVHSSNYDKDPLMNGMSACT